MDFQVELANSLRELQQANRLHDDEIRELIQEWQKSQRRQPLTQ